MSEDKIQNTKEALLELSKMNLHFEIDRTFIRNGANAINQLQQENKQLKEQNDDLFNENHKLRIELEHSIPEEQYREMLHRKNKQLQQSEQVIEEIKNNLNIDEDILKTCKVWDVNGIEIYNILNKYKNRGE